MNFINEFPSTNFHELNLDWFFNKFKALLQEWEQMKIEFDNLNEAFDALKQYVNDYFDNLDVQEEINNKLNAMASDGSLGVILAPFVKTDVENWLEENITQETGYVLDTSLTIAGAGADAEAVGLKTFLFRGEISTLGITDLTQCKGPGYYRFKTSDIPNINAPSDVTQGGFILAFPNTETTRWQILISNTVQYFRYNSDTSPASWRALPTTDTTLSIAGKSADAKTVGDNALLWRGDITRTYGVTDLNDCVDNGWYSWYTDDIATIANMPEGITTGGVMLRYGTEGTDFWQFLMNNTHMFIRYKTFAWHQLNKYPDNGVSKVRWVPNGDGNDGSAEYLSIFQYPSNEASNIGRIVYNLYRCVSDNANVWRLGYVYKNIDGVNTKLTRQAEWECAMSIEGGGFIGGYIHGYENNPTIHVFVDNTEVSQSDIAVATSFETLRIITTSDIIYNGSILCNHGKEYVFKDGMLTVKQSLNWKQSATINNCFLTMLPPLKTIVSKYYYDGAFVETAFPSSADFTIALPEMRECYAYSDNVTMRAGWRRYPNVAVRRTPYVTDHNSTYYKFYFPACENATVSNGDIWTSESYFEIK